MIRKKELLDGLDELTLQVLKQGEEICLLKQRVAALEPEKIKIQVKPAQKRGRGRPRKDAK